MVLSVGCPTITGHLAHPLPVQTAARVTGLIHVDVGCETALDSALELLDRGKGKGPAFHSFPTRLSIHDEEVLRCA